MEPQNTNNKTLEEASESSAFFSCSADCNGVADSEVQASENRQGGDSFVNVQSVSKTLASNDGNDIKIEEDNDGKRSSGSDTVRKIDVSGDNLSLVVDFSGSVGEIKPNSHCDDNTSSRTAKQVGDRAQEFSVGDFVWVSTKKRSWWPAKVSDLNPDQKECLKVAYFGQNHSDWCTPAKLSPFHMNFEKMVKQSAGRRFSGAVEKAMEDFGKNLTLVLARACVSRDYSKQLGVLSKFSIERLVPKELLARLKNLAKFVSIPGMLESTVMQSRLSAFYLSTGHKQIPLDQLQEDSTEQCPGLIKEKPGRKIQEGSSSKKRRREEDSKIKVKKGNENSDDIENEKSFASRDRKKSKYLSYPYVNSNRAEVEKVPENTDQLVDSPAVINRSSTKRFQKNWLKKFISEENSTSTQALLVNASPANLLTELRSLAVDCQCGNENKNFGLSEWFVSKFRFSVYHDESTSLIHCKNSTCAANLDFAEEPRTDPEQKTPKKKKKKSKVKSLSVLSDVKTMADANSFTVKDSPRVDVLETPGEKSASLKTPDKPAAELPDLNNRSAMLNATALDNSKNRSVFSSSDVGKSGTKMLNFQGIIPCSADRIPNPGLTFDQLASDGKSSAIDTNPEKKKRKRKKKGTEEHIETMLSGAVPDLNGSTIETTNLLTLQEKPKQRRRRRTKAEMINAETAKGTTTTTLLLKFAPNIPVPSKDDLTSTFSGFGPLMASETQLLEQPGGAQVAFVSSADAAEALKSLEKSNPFGETLISFQIQPKTPKRRKKAPTTTEPTGPATKQSEAPMSVDQIRQKLVMMTTMLEKAGDSLSQEMRAQLECEIKRLLEKVSSMPSSSS